MKKIAIIGPTGIGKTKVSVNLAEKINAEIISSDSMQIYKNMDIGTGKASFEERKKIPHHLISIVEPGFHFNVSEYVKMATKVIDLIEKKGKKVIITGGTGMYLKALIMGIIQDEHDSVSERKKIEQEVKISGIEPLLKELEKIDPEKHKNLSPNDHQRIIRAVSFYRRNKTPISSLQNTWQKPPSDDYLLVGLSLDRNKLYEKINKRVVTMIECGFLSEVKNLIKMNIPLDSTSWQAIGYRHLYNVITNKLDIGQAITLIQRDSRRYAKRQLTWFNKTDSIKWFDASDIFKCSDKIYNYLNKIHSQH